MSFLNTVWQSVCTACVLTLTCGSASSPANCETHTPTVAMSTCSTANTWTHTQQHTGIDRSYTHTVCTPAWCILCLSSNQRGAYSKHVYEQPRSRSSSECVGFCFLCVRICTVPAACSVKDLTVLSLDQFYVKTTPQKIKFYLNFIIIFTYLLLQTPPVLINNYNNSKKKMQIGGWLMRHSLVVIKNSKQQRLRRQMVFWFLPFAPLFCLLLDFHLCI